MEQYKAGKKHMLNLYRLIEKWLRPLRGKISFQTVCIVLSIYILKNLRRCTFVYIPIFQKDIHATVTSIHTFTFHFISFYLVRKKIFLPQVHINFIKARKKESERVRKGAGGAMGRKGKRERERKKERRGWGGRGKREREGRREDSFNN